MADRDANDSYVEPARAASAEVKEKGSRFLAELAVVRTPEEAEQAVERVRRREYDATHHCTAWRLGPEGDRFRYNDDGEPAGSAGPPILRQIEGHGVTNAVVIVTRYYGGTKLGVGGLVRAYGDAASRALDAAGRRRVVVRTRVLAAFAYPDTSPALHCVEQFDIEVVDRNYSDETVLTLDVRRGQLEAFEAAFTEALGGRGRIDRAG